MSRISKDLSWLRYGPEFVGIILTPPTNQGDPRREEASCLEPASLAAWTLKQEVPAEHDRCTPKAYIRESVGLRPVRRRSGALS